MSFFEKANRFRKTLVCSKEEAEFEFNLSMASQSASASLQVAYAYEYGKGVKVDIPKAIHWYEKTFEHENNQTGESPLNLNQSSCADRLFFWYCCGRSINSPHPATHPKDFAKAVYWGEQSMSNDSERGTAVHFAVAAIYEEGLGGVEVNKTKASQIYRHLGFSTTTISRMGNYEIDIIVIDHRLLDNTFNHRLYARCKVWELETGKEMESAPESFINSEEWNIISESMPKLDESLSKYKRYYNSYQSLGPDV